jgi:hypothetical protein
MRTPSPVDYHGLDIPTTPPHLRSPISSTPTYPSAGAAIVEITLYDLYILKHHLSAMEYQILFSRPDSYLYSSRDTTLTLIDSMLAHLTRLASRIEGLRPYPQSYYRTPSAELSSFVEYINSRPSKLVAILPSMANRNSSIDALMTEAIRAVRKDMWSFFKQHIFDCARLKRGWRIRRDDRPDAVAQVMTALGKEIDRFERAMRGERESEAGSEAGEAPSSLDGDTTAGFEISSPDESIDELSERVNELSDKLDLLGDYLKYREKHDERQNRAIEKLLKRIARLERTA